MKTLLNDCLTNCAKECCETFEHSSIAKCAKGHIYGRGIINGIVSTLMSQGCSFKEALAEVKRHIPNENNVHGTFDVRCIPPMWIDDWNSV